MKPSTARNARIAQIAFATAFVLPLLMLGIDQLFVLKVEIDLIAFYAAALSFFLSVIFAILSWAARSSKLIVGLVTLFFVAMIVTSLIPQGR